MGESWSEEERQFRLAVQAYYDAVEHLDSKRDFHLQWQMIERARAEAEHARSLLLRRQRSHRQTPMNVAGNHDGSEYGTELLVLGDVGQHGG
jgi:hypothetical protein